MPQEYLLELVKARVVRADRPWQEGIATRDGKTLPFIVERVWSGPAGNYVEQWSIRSDMATVVYQGPARYIRVQGMQSISTYRDRVDDPIGLDAGTYRLIFVVEGRFMGSATVQVEAVGKAVA